MEPPDATRIRGITLASNMKIGIIGLGLVGKAVQQGFVRIGRDVVGYDVKLPETRLEDVLPCEVVFISVPTPPAKDGSCDVSIVEKVVGELAAANYTGLAVIKSTVEPGTTDRLSAKYPSLRLAFCPEFLREKATFTDFVEQHDVCVIGTNTAADYELIRAAHDPLPQSYALLTPLEAEFTKYFSNIFNAMRITFANQFYDLCEAAGADYQHIKNAVVKRRNIPNFYLDCNENFRGFGGSCLPKDTAALAAYAGKLGIEVPLFEQILEVNRRYATTVL